MGSFRHRVASTVASVAVVATMLTQPPWAAAQGAPFNPSEQESLDRASWFQVGYTGEDDRSVIFVGTLAGTARRVGTAETAIQASGPANGRVLAWWREDDATVFHLYDVLEQTDELVLTVPYWVTFAAVLDPSGRSMYYVPTRDDGTTLGLWKLDFGQGEPERLVDRWDAETVLMQTDFDGSNVVIWDGVPGTAYRYRVYDVAADRMHVLEGRDGQVVGLLGDGLVVYPSEPDGLAYPLTSINLETGSKSTLVDGQGTFAAIVRGQAEPILVYDRAGSDDAYQVWAQRSGTSPKQIWEGGKPWSDPPLAFVRPDYGSGIESPGWLPVMPEGWAYVWPAVDDGSAPAGSRLLVNLQTGEQVVLPEITLEEQP